MIISNRAVVQISREKFKELVDKSVELEKIKNMVSSLQRQLKNKSDTIEQLKSKIRCYETTKKKEENKKEIKITQKKEPNVSNENENVYLDRNFYIATII